MKTLFSRAVGFLYRKVSELAFETMLPHFNEDFKCERVFMIVQLDGGPEEWHGKRKKGKIDLGNTFSWSRFFKKPLVTNPESLADIQKFLLRCQYLSDRETRGCDDYWEPPDIFEERKTGDCEDHAIWAWRHLHEMGYKTRLVLGDCKGGHAWVHIFVNDRAYLLEATQKNTGFPVAKSYLAYWSVERLTNKKFAVYEHTSDFEPENRPRIAPEECD